MTLYLSPEVQCALGEMAANLVRVNVALDEAMTIMHEMEWLDTDDGRACGWCGCDEDLGHATRCALGCALDTYYRRR